MAIGLPPGVKEVQRIAAPGGGFYVLGDDGGVFAISDASGKAPAFYGSVPMTNPQGSRQYTGIELNPTGGYKVHGSDGALYDFNTEWARNNNLNVPDQGNTLTSDPAFLAFLRTSGLSLETAANQVRTQTASINAAKDVAMGDIKNQYDETARRTHGGFESRGVSRGSSHQQAQDQVARARGSAELAKGNEAAGQISGLNQGLVQQVLAQQNKAAELGLSTAQSQDYDASLNTLKKKYGSELSAGGLSI